MLNNNQLRDLLERLGYDEWFDSKNNEHINNSFSVARIIEVNKNKYKISDGQYEYLAELPGRFLYSIESSLDYPTVGDWCAVQCFDDSSPAIIHSVLPRKSLLKRKTSGKMVDYQLIAANIDFAFIVQSADSNFNLNRLERYLVMINESKIEPIIILSKTDLLSDAELEEITDKIRRISHKYTLLPISSISDNGIEALQKELMPYKTYCLLGSSGVGKTTLLNKLLGEQRFSVSEVREKDSKGRHTTTRRQLIRLESGSIFIDTPGIRELGNFDVHTGMEETFDDIALYGAKCRFNNCTHRHEKGCVVRDAVEQGIIDIDRYNNYLMLQKEAAYYEMSYLEKRKKDKSFGKMIKNHKKLMRKK